MQTLAFYILGIMVIMQIRADGNYPFPKSWSKEAMMVVVLIQAIAIAFFVSRACYALITMRSTKVYAVSNRTNIIISALIPVFALPVIYALHYVQAGFYLNARYRYDATVFNICFLLGILPLLFFWGQYLLTSKYKPRLYLVAVLMSAIIIKAIPIILFPLSPVRSDMLPIIRESGLNIINGVNPYQFYVLEGLKSYYNYRLPGLIMAYFPATLSGLDLRFLTLACEVALFGLIIKRLGPLCKGGKVPWGIIFCLTVFLYFPYWHYRHELYEMPFWLALYFAVMALYEQRKIIFTISLGLMIAMHQWGWVFAPYMLLIFFKKNGLRKTVTSAFASLALGAAIIFAGAWPFLNSFYEHIFLSYNKIPCVWESYSVGSICFTPLFAKLGIIPLMKLIQALIQIGLLVITFKYIKSIESLMGILAFSLLGMVLFNPVSWNYHYLLIIMVLIFGLYFRELRFGKITYGK